MKKQYSVQNRQYYVITAGMILLCVVFQLAGNFSFVRYRNPESVLASDQTDSYGVELMARMKEAPDYVNEKQMEYMVISSDFSGDSQETASVLETLEGMKKYHACVSLSEVKTMKVSSLPSTLKAVIICGDKEGAALSLQQRQELVARGIHMIYTQMPSVNGIRKNELAPLFGIYRMNGKLKQKGMRFTDEVFLGGNLDLEDISYTLEEVQLEPTCKIYAYGLKGRDGEQGKRNEELPPILWRNTVGKSKVFVVNGNFFEKDQGYGILAAILTQIYGDYLYPVVNASVMIYNALPYQGTADEKRLKELYGRDSLRFQTDILLPDLVSICKRLDIVPTFYTDTESRITRMDYFRHSVLDLQGEILYKENAPSFPVLVTGFQKDDGELTKLYSTGSAFGIVVHKVDVSELMNPKDEAANWVTASRDYTRFIAYYKEDFGDFECMTAREASTRYMEYRLMKPHITYSEDCIDVEIEQMPEKAGFLLRTDRVVGEAEGCKIHKLCEGAYLIETGQSHFQIPLQEGNARYQGDFSEQKMDGGMGE